MIYLDNAATTKVAEEVFDAMIPFLNDNYGNPGSKYSIGRYAKEAIDKSRKIISEYLGCSPNQIVFTSSGSEANNIVFKGSVHLLNNDNSCIATSSIEHESVLRAAESLNAFGCDHVKIKPMKNGTVDNAIEFLSEHRGIGLVSVMKMNNETGVETDVKSIAEFCNEKGILFHTDCVQAAGCCPINVSEIGCDFLTISAHKIHGPKGIGLLYVKNPELLNPLIHGGDNQEFGLRGGTENVAGIVGFAKAFELMNSKDYEKIKKSRTLLYRLLHNIKTTDVIDNGVVSDYGKTINLSFSGVDSETLLMLLDNLGIFASSGSACRSLVQEPSYVLTEMGVDEEAARSSIRLSVSRYTTDDEIYSAVNGINVAIKQLINK